MILLSLQRFHTYKYVVLEIWALHLKKKKKVTIITKQSHLEELMNRYGQQQSPAVTRPPHPQVIAH